MRARRQTVALLTIAMAVAVAVASVSAQPGNRQPKDHPKYDVANETTIHGTVTEVVETKSPKGWTGIHLMLDVENTTVEVHVGPKSFLTEKNFEVVVGDHLIILGARLETEDETKDSLIARKMTRGDETLVVRDEEGLPVWRGSRGRRGW